MLLGDVHAAACGLQSKSLRALRYILGFFDSLGRPAKDVSFHSEINTLKFSEKDFRLVYKRTFPSVLIVVERR